MRDFVKWSLGVIAPGLFAIDLVLGHKSNAEIDIIMDCANRGAADVCRQRTYGYDGTEYNIVNVEKAKTPSGDPCLVVGISPTRREKHRPIGTYGHQVVYGSTSTRLNLNTCTP